MSDTADLLFCRLAFHPANTARRCNRHPHRTGNPSRRTNHTPTTSRRCTGQTLLLTNAPTDAHEPRQHSTARLSRQPLLLADNRPFGADLLPHRLPDDFPLLDDESGCRRHATGTQNAPGFHPTNAARRWNGSANMTGHLPGNAGTAGHPLLLLLMQDGLPLNPQLLPEHLAFDTLLSPNRLLQHLRLMCPMNSRPCCVPSQARRRTNVARQRHRCTANRPQHAFGTGHIPTQRLQVQADRNQVAAEMLLQQTLHYPQFTTELPHVDANRHECFG